MNREPRGWEEMAGAIAILAGIALTLQGQMAESALPHIVAGVVLGAVGVWLMAQANRRTPS